MRIGDRPELFSGLCSALPFVHQDTRSPAVRPVEHGHASDTIYLFDHPPFTVVHKHHIVRREAKSSKLDDIPGIRFDECSSSKITYAQSSLREKRAP